MKKLWQLLLLLFILANPTKALAQIPRASDVLTGLNSSFYSNPNIHLASIVFTILTWVFDVVGILAFVWAFIGVFQYITAGGNKESLAKARARMVWVFIGLLFLMISFALAHFVYQTFGLAFPNVPAITPF